MASNLEGKVALVTGGSSGIGKASALAFVREGARVVIADVNPPGGQETLEQGILSDPGQEEQITRRHPMGRLGRPEEIAESVVWLCSDAASFVTGHTLTVDGGQVAQ